MDLVHEAVAFFGGLLLGEQEEVVKQEDVQLDLVNAGLFLDDAIADELALLAQEVQQLRVRL